MFLDLSKIVELRKDWKLAELDSDIFINNSLDVFKNIRIGGTFIPEGLVHEGLSNEEILDSLKYIVEELNVRNLRLGIRLNSIDLDKQSLGLYKDILDYCFQKKVKMTLNLGPIKLCGWPEYHLSETLLSKIPNLPKNRSIIKSDSNLSDEAGLELEKMLQLICSTFTKKNLENVVSLQVENEGFNPFGEYQWIFHADHITKVIGIIEKYLPGRRYLFNSAGFFDLNSIVNFISTRSDSSRFIVGLDYYYIFDTTSKLKWYKWLDLYIFSWKFKNFGLETLQKYQQKYKFQTEVTEAQMEPWGNAREPGNSIESLQYVLLRTSRFLMKNNGIINMYGLEKFGARMSKNNFNDQHKKMSKLIKKINRLS
jgi:hypothetical protein